MKPTTGHQIIAHSHGPNHFLDRRPGPPPLAGPRWLALMSGPPVAGARAPLCSAHVFGGGAEPVAQPGQSAVTLRAWAGDRCIGVTSWEA